MSGSSHYERSPEVEQAFREIMDAADAAESDARRLAAIEAWEADDPGPDAPVELVRHWARERPNDPNETRRIR